MDELERGELLMQIKEKLDNLIKAFDKVSNGTGFPRCVEREQRIKRLEQDVIAIKQIVASIDVLARTVESLEKVIEEQKKKKAQFDAWLMRATWMVVIAGVVKLAFF
jgi:hypothetical protein